MNNARQNQYNSIRSRVGNTPLHRIRHIKVPNGNRIWAKLEFLNPTESAFDRVYPGLFEAAELAGHIAPGVNPVIECSTGNAGASFAWTARELGYESHVIIHEDSPFPRIEQIRRLGAHVILSPAGEYGSGYVALLNSVLEENRRALGAETHGRLFAITKIVPEARDHHRGIVHEALAQLKSTQLANGFSAFVAAVGSGDLICGVSSEFRRLGHHVEVIGMESKEMPTVSSLRAGRVLEATPLPIPDLMLGVTGTNLPMNRLNINFDLIDDVEGVSVEEWKSMDARLVEEEGLAVGRTSAGSLAAALRVAERVTNADILTIFFDPKWKYGDAFAPKFPELYA